jgi:hypothetical protein
MNKILPSKNLHSLLRLYGPSPSYDIKFSSQGNFLTKLLKVRRKL